MKILESGFTRTKIGATSTLGLVSVSYLTRVHGAVHLTDGFWYEPCRNFRSSLLVFEKCRQVFRTQHVSLFSASFVQGQY